MSTILIVEDEPGIADIYADVCAGEGWTTETALGMAAVARAEAGGIDAILLDLLLPDVDGTEIFKALRERTATAKIPIVIVTAVPHVGDAGRALGAFATLEKPFMLTELIDTIRAALGNT